METAPPKISVTWLQCLGLSKANAEAVVASHRHTEPSAAAKFVPKPVTLETVEPGKLYIWQVQKQSLRVVRLNDAGDGIMTLNDDDEWLFMHALKGALYGPILLA